MSTTLRVRSSGSAFCRNYQRTKGCREEFVVVIVFTFNTVYCFQFWIISVMLPIYAKLSSHVIAIQDRERAAVNMQGTVFTLARLKIVPIYHQELDL